MKFSSFAFLSFFLPVTLVLHTVLPGKRSMKAKNALLIAASLVFYAYGEIIYIFLLLASVLMNYLFGLALGRKKLRSVVAAAVTVNIAMLFVFKYAGFAAGAVNLLLPASAQIPVPDIRLPIGISFYTFQALSYVIDVYRGEVGAQKSFPALLLYISFFPQLIAGPIVRYCDIEKQIGSREVTVGGIKRGSYRFLCGLGKKILISDAMAYAADTVFALGGAELGALSAWIGAVAYVFQIYFDFSGYSDMAIGLGRMFGFEFRENFNYPYTSVSIQDFWRRWHISLSTWFREYLYIPLGGNRRGKARTLRNRYIVFLATGLWHGANWTFLLWGLYHGTLLVLESVGAIPAAKVGKHKEGEAEEKRTPGRALFLAASRAYTFLAVLFGFVLFRADSLPQAGAFFAAMFGFGVHGGADLVSAAQFLSPYYIFILAAAVVGSTPYPRKLWLRICGADGGVTEVRREPLMMAAGAAVLVLCFMALASNSYSPFIYFRF